MSRDSSYKSVSVSRWEEFKVRHRRKRSRSFSSDSLEFSDSDSEPSSALFNRFRPAQQDVLFSPTKVYATESISLPSPSPSSRSRLTLSFKKRRARSTRKQLCTSRAFFKANKSKQGPTCEKFVTRFRRRYLRIWKKPPALFSKLVIELLRFQNSFVAALTPLQRDEFNAHYFKLSGLKTIEPKSISKSKMVTLDSSRCVYLFKQTLTTPNLSYFDNFSNLDLAMFFTLNFSQSLRLWQTYEKLATPIGSHFWLFINKYAPARFFLQPTLQDSFVNVFSLSPNSSPQYSATLSRFARFINSAREHPTSNPDKQVAFALTALKRCDMASYHFIQGWLLKQMSKGLAFTTLRTYCLHLSWFQQPDPRRYANSQHFRRFLLTAVARFFHDESHHGSDAMDQATLAAFWNVFDTSNFSEAQYDKHGFVWILQLALRVTEAINNMWSNVDFNLHNVGVVQKIRNAKNQKRYGKTYFLALKATGNEFCPVKCLRFLAKHGSSDFVFYDRRKNRAWTTRSINKRFKFYIDQLPEHLRTGKKYTVYSLRSTFACSMAQANVDVSLIQQFMRQKSATSTRTYIQKAFPHLQFANLLQHTSQNPFTESFGSSFLSNLSNITQI